MKRKEILRDPTYPMDVKPKSVDKILEDMESIGFQGRKLGEAFSVWKKMLDERKIIVIMTLSGAMTAGGMRRIISYLMKRRMIDVLVSTGANLYHDLYEAMFGKHFLGTPHINDVMLRKHMIDRVYDVYADENKFYKLDTWIEKEFCSTLKNGYPYSSREILHELGKFAYDKARDRNSMVLSAYKYGIPIFVPAIGDSSLGFSIMFANRRQGKRIRIDYLKDVHESSLITQKASKAGLAIIGGGVPKNFAQQTAVVASYSTRHDKAFSHAFQLCPDPPQWGGLSGATLEEAQSWGKYKPGASMVNCYCDATIALPILAHGLAEEYKTLSRNVPEFNFSNDGLKINYSRQRL